MNTLSYVKAPNSLKFIRYFRYLSRSLLQLIAGIILFVGQQNTYAAVIIVNSLADDGGGSLCTLREAIESAATDSAVGGCTAGYLADFIGFNSNLAGGVITLSGTELTINSTIQIDGDLNNDDIPDIEVSAGNASRVFHIQGGGVATVLHGLTISDGFSTTGAGILVESGSVGYLFNSTFSNNSATLRGGGIAVNGATAIVEGSTVTSNTSDINGGGIHAIYNADVTVTDTLVSGNTAIFGGAGLYVHSNDTTVTLNGSTVSNNTLSNADGDGAGILVYSSNLTVNDSNITGNETQRSGGGLYINENSIVSLNGSDVSGNTASPGGGGGIFVEGNSSLSMTNSTLSENHGTSNGGGILASDATVDMTGTAISDNTTDFAGGGIRGQSSSAINLTGCTVSGNTAGSGGGLSLISSASVSLVNSTVSGNTVISTGGGLYSAVGQVTLVNTTFSDNTAGNLGGGLYIADSVSAVVQLTNSIIANSSGGDCQSGPSVSFTSTASLIEDGGSDCNTPALTGDPQLLALADNGGPTDTHMPLSNSPAIDAGDNTDCGAGKTIETDQRGQPRDDGACDIGAVELQSATLQWSADSASVSEDDGSVLLTVNRTEFSDNAVSVDYTTMDGSAKSPDDYSADTNTLYFNTGDTSEELSISINDDTLAEGREDFTVILSNPQATTGNDVVRIGSNTIITVTIDDTDPGILVTPVSGLKTTESGGTDSFSMVLTTKPDADVTILLSSSNPAEGSVSPTQLTFTTIDWDEPKTAVVTGVDDDIDDGDIEFIIKTGPVSGSAEYTGIDPADVMVTNIDDDDAVAGSGGSSGGGLTLGALLPLLILLNLSIFRLMRDHP